MKKRWIVTLLLFLLVILVRFDIITFTYSNHVIFIIGFYILPYIIFYLQGKDAIKDKKIKARIKWTNYTKEFTGDEAVRFGKHLQIAAYITWTLATILAYLVLFIWK